jgi:hypothetical protein
MTRVPTGWSVKAMMWLLVCLVAIATSDDFWLIAMSSSGSQLVIVADDDDPDDSAERMPACASGGVGYTDLRWFVRSAIEITGPADLGNGFVLPYGPRGPPADRSDEQSHTDSPHFWPATADLSIVAPLPAATTLHHATLEVQTRAGFSRNRTSGVDRYRRWNVDMRVHGRSAVRFSRPCAFEPESHGRPVAVPYQAALSKEEA